MTKKPFKVLSTTAMAAALATSALVPAAVYAAEDNVALSVTDYIVEVDGVLYSVDTELFLEAKAGGQGYVAKYVKTADGKVYDINDYLEAKASDIGLTMEDALALLAEDQEAEKDVTYGSIELDEDGELVVTPPETEPIEGETTVESVSAINGTTVKVSFNNELTEVAKENFAIEGVTVSEAVIADNKKDVFVTVAPGFAFDTEYTVTVSNLTETPLTTTFTSLAVTDIWDLQIDAPERLEADGVDTGVITFKLVDKETGEVDTKANDVVLDVNSTYGYLSQKRVTMQNGEATVILRSEFQEGGVTAKIEAQVIEAKAGSIYKELVGKVVAQPANVKFGIGNTGEGPGAIVLKSLKAANTNEADRVVLTFDHEIEAKELYDVDTGVSTGAVEVFQKSGANVYDLEVVGFAINPSDKKSVTVYLGKDPVTDVTDQEFLQDNTDVYVTAKIGQAQAQTVSFKFADARTPNLASVKPVALSNGTTSNKQITVAFTEPVLSADFGIDARFNGSEANPNHFDVEHGDVTWDLKAKKFVDKRNEVTLTLNSSYQEPDKNADGSHVYPAGFFKPGTHDLEASSIFDFAANTDKNNIGTTQNLSFTIAVNDSLVQPEVTVDSPEQFRVGFNMDHSIVKADGTPSDFETEVQFQVLKKADPAVSGSKDEWVAVDGTYFTKAKKVDGSSVVWADFLEFTDLPDGSIKIETTTDWTYIYDTTTTKDNYYNDEFRLVLPKNQVVTAANGKKNAEDIILPLTKAPNSALATPDIKSPEIIAGSIKKVDNFVVATPEFEVGLTEPVKIFTGDDAGQTLAQKQTELPEPKVEFIGKDKDGKTRTFLGSVKRYKDAINKDLIVEWTAGSETPQTVVDAGGSTEWTLVIKSISDDVGNTAPTASGTFELEPTQVVVPTDVFRVLPNGGDAIGDDKSTDTNFAVKGLEGDTIELTFTQAVAVTGLGSATNVKNYALNGKDLPTGASIALGTTAGQIDDKKVVIKLANGTLNASNVITLAGNLESKEGTVITKDLSFTFLKVTIAQQELTAATDAVVVAEGSKTQTDVNAAQALVTALPAGTAKDALQVRIDAVQDAIDATADQDAADVVIDQITAATTQAEIEAARDAYEALTAPQQALVTNEAALQTKEQDLVDAVVLAVSATYEAADAGDTVVIDAQPGYTYVIQSSDDTSVIDDAGEIVADGTAELTVEVTHTSSGKTATTTVSVTVTL